ncbi:MAG: restriction endonuclease subunit S [Thermodesulfobacteriota bacterium]
MKYNITSSWTEVPLGEILTILDEQVVFDDMAEYITITVKRRHGGLEAREKLYGNEIKTKKQYRLHQGAFIISRVQCWHAAFAIVPNNIPENMIASQNYDQFEISPEVDKSFFWWLSHSPRFVETVRSSASGVVIEKMVFNRDAWLQKTISLPPKTEQQRIVARIEALAGRLAEAQSLRREAIEETEKLLVPVDMQIWPDQSLVGAPLLKDVTSYLARGRQSKQGPSTHYLIKTQHVQMDHYVPSKMTLAPEVAAKVLPEAFVRNKDILIACSAAGCLGRVAYYEETKISASTDTHIAIVRANPNLVLPEYLYSYLKGAQGQYQLRSRERGDWKREKIGFRLTELNLADLQRVPVPVPSLKEQRQLVAYLDGLQAQVSQLRLRQAETQQALDALMPSILDKAFKGEL